jgi:voltage-gated potassium channel
MNKAKTKLKVFLALFILITAIGTLVFMRLENLSLIDAFYYNIVTMSTVGYGDIYAHSPLGRMFTVLIILAGGAAFLGVVANATELVILKQDSNNRQRKINMVLGVFFSEVGNHLLRLFSQHHKNAVTVKQELHITPAWTREQFLAARKAWTASNPAMDSHRMDIPNLNAFLGGKRDFLVGLLENPVLIEHEGFGEALLAVFHLQDELCCRKNLSDLPDADRKHLAGDMNRAYGQLVDQWLVYLEHLKEQYPYIFSLAVRNNPFEPDSDPVVLG